MDPAGPLDALGGSLLPAEGTAARVAARRHFVSLLELPDRAGERIARPVGVEAALLTTGTAGALLLARPRCGLTLLSAVGTPRRPCPRDRQRRA
jgi:seryl-tRNA(Sec) selenium transferase